MKQETIDLVVELRDAGKSWFDVHRSVPQISAEQCRRIYREAKGLNKQQTDVRLRDYFASKAMQAIIGLCYKDFDVDKDKKDVSQDAYAIADAMMKAREQ